MPQGLAAATDERECNRCKMKIMPPEPTAKHTCCNRIWHPSCISLLKDLRSVAGKTGIVHMYFHDILPSGHLTNRLSESQGNANGA